jgi:hypothetical protein
MAGAAATAATATAATAQATTLAVVNKSMPDITGVFETGQRLTAGRGTWTVDAKVTYQWLGPGRQPIPGATEKYLRIPEGITAVSVAVTGSKAGRTRTTVTTLETPVRTGFVVPKPTIVVGNTRCIPAAILPVVGDVLDTAWTGTADSVQFRWYRNGQPITGEWKRTYRMTRADEEATLTFAVTATKAGYKSRTVYSDPIGRLTSDCRYTSPVALPRIGGSGTIGRPLSVKMATPLPGSTLTYVWRVGIGPYSPWGKNYQIVSTSPTFTPRSDIIGKTVRVEVYVFRPGYPSLQVLPALSTVVHG